LVIFPLWNKGRYGPTALMAKSLYGWAHVFALVDIVRGRRLGWQTTGGKGSRPTRRIWRSLAIWGGLTSAAWLALAAYRMISSPVNFVFLLLIGLIYASTCVVMPLMARTQAERRHGSG
jgi:cellulose synthase (UDP-forming)